jgi:lipopolysaccharide transport system permease protein
MRFLRAAYLVLAMAWQYRETLLATTVIELRKRYAGSIFGLFWILLYPVLLLSIYLFVYLVVFKVRFPDFSEYEYVLFVFAGLVPYLGLMDALSTGSTVIKQNIHMVKNVMLPIDLVPVRAVLVSLCAQCATMSVLLALGAIGGKLSFHTLWLPVAVILIGLFMLGLVFIIGAFGVVMTDLPHIINLVLLLIMFLSPIGFKPEMVPPGMSALITYNPVHYLTDVVRCAVLYGRLPSLQVSLVFITICLGTFIVGAAFFRRFKNLLVDYE